MSLREALAGGGGLRLLLLTLVEIAPGIDLQTQVLDQMELSLIHI